MINWKHEFKGKGSPEGRKELCQRKNADSGWVDYATVFYWCQDHPAGFKHEPLVPVAEQIKDLLKSSVNNKPGSTKDFPCP